MSAHLRVEEENSPLSFPSYPWPKHWLNDCSGGGVGSRCRRVMNCWRSRTIPTPSSAFRADPFSYPTMKPNGLDGKNTKCAGARPPSPSSQRSPNPRPNTPPAALPLTLSRNLFASLQVLSGWAAPTMTRTPSIGLMKSPAIASMSAVSRIVCKFDFVGTLHATFLRNYTTFGIPPR